MSKSIMKTLALAFLLTTVAAAEELYVPLAGRTDVDIVNPSAERAFVELELLGGTTAHVELAAGERMQWSGSESGVLRVSGPVQVTATQRREEASASVPVLGAIDGVDEGTMTARPPWRGEILIVNPRDESVVVTVDGAVQVLAPHGVVRGSAFRADAPLLAFAYDVNDATGTVVFVKVAPHARTLRRRAVRSITPPPQPQAQTVVLTPSKDNTLYESGNGELSNGAGPHLFIGTTQSRTRRRAVVAFDVAAQVPPGSRITRVSLTMTVSQTISGAEPATLHRVTADWGQGTSNAGAIRDGGGAPSTNNDATWRHTFFPDRRWTNAGGDFDAAADATASVAGASGVWESAAMIGRVQQWLDQPASNFGWIVIGNESRSASAKRFDSREVVNATSRPSLRIEFER